jgi:hypothetical protein
MTPVEENGDFRFWHKVDIGTVLNDVRFWG